MDNTTKIFQSESSGEHVHLTLFLVDQFTMLPLSCIIEPLRLTNSYLGEDYYSWSLASRDGESVQSSNGLEFNISHAVHDLQNPRNIVVCSGVDAHHYRDHRAFAWLRKWASNGAHIGAICTGAHILAKTGLLNGYRCTVHWSSLDGLSEEYPELDLSAELYQVDRTRFTCAGGIAALDMVLQDITARHGYEASVHVAEQFLLERMREGNDVQRLPLQSRLRINHPKLIHAISEMESNTEVVLSRNEVAKRVGLSRRQLERLFQRYVNTSPARYYLKLRLKKAKNLLSQTPLAITEIAFACGFTSASHFSKCYRDLFNITPRAQRVKMSSPDAKASLLDDEHKKED